MAAPGAGGLTAAGSAPIVLNGATTTLSVAHDLLSSYVARRKVLDRAAQLTAEMRTQATDITEVAEQNRLNTLAGSMHNANRSQQSTAAAAEAASASASATGSAAGGAGRDGAGDGTGTGGEEKEGGKPSEGDRGSSAGEAAQEGGTARTVGGIAFEANSEQQCIDAAISAKSAKLSKLRGMQHWLSELEEQVDEETERALREAANAKKVSLTKSTAAALEAAGAPGRVRLVENDDSVSSSQGASSQRRRQSRSTLSGSITAIPTMTAAQATLQEVRANYNTLLSTNNWSAVMPTPPQTFSSEAFALSVEYLGRALEVIVAATDTICVRATFKSREQSVSVEPQTRVLQAQASYAQLCFDTAQRHMTHFELGAKALVEGGAFEVNSARGQFLMRKETLTAQEQKEKQAEEQHSSLVIRLRNLLHQCSMWEEILLQREPTADSAQLWSAEELALGSTLAGSQPCGLGRWSALWGTTAGAGAAVAEAAGGGESDLGAPPRAGAIDEAAGGEGGGGASYAASHGQSAAEPRELRKSAAGGRPTRQQQQALQSVKSPRSKLREYLAATSADRTSHREDQPDGEKRKPLWTSPHPLPAGGDTRPSVFPADGTGTMTLGTSLVPVTSSSSACAAGPSGVAAGSYYDQEAVEVRVSGAWGNPYVRKARQYENSRGRPLLLPLSSPGTAAGAYPREAGGGSPLSRSSQTAATVTMAATSATGADDASEGVGETADAMSDGLASATPAASAMLTPTLSEGYQDALAELGYSQQSRETAEARLLRLLRGFTRAARARPPPRTSAARVGGASPTTHHGLTASNEAGVPSSSASKEETAEWRKERAEVRVSAQRLVQYLTSRTKRPSVAT